jgi:hypothetical protein
VHRKSRIARVPCGRRFHLVARGEAWYPALSVADAPVKFSWASCKSRPQFLNSFM